MKSRSIIFLLSGIAIGTVAGLLIAPQRGIKSRKELLKKSKKYKKAFKETANKYKEKLGSATDLI